MRPSTSTPPAAQRSETHRALNHALFTADGGVDAGAVCAANERLVWFWVHRSRWRESDPNDLHAAGMEGLLHAAGKYDPAHGTTFATYATWWIRQAIDRAGARDARWREHTTDLEERSGEHAHAMRAGDLTAGVAADAVQVAALRDAVANGSAALRTANALDGNLAATARHIGVRENVLRWQLQQEASRLAHPASGLLDDPWRDDAACRGMDVAAFFPGSVAGRQCCARCPVRAACGASAVANWRLAGLWGGTTATQREQLRRSADRPPSK